IADVDIMGRKLGKALRYAAAIRARWAVIIGPEEIARGKVVLRNMDSGAQDEVVLADLAASIRA
ncbi:MAG: His/Gly/Thr/Pro-type tRNA ligase C-terminal domain-containing protein, partial [Candidatus Methanomethylophilus sp.]|nr:His/Gly/Thr/Pro-type tRNA ligase C-terminal domain-containing protein [Methanomethylophilus sp.]